MLEPWIKFWTSLSFLSPMNPSIMQEAIVQALPASRSKEDTITHQSPSRQKAHNLQSQAKQVNQSSLTPSSRCTRSQAAPDWTVREMLVLLNEIAAIDEEWLKELSSYQRWKMLSDSCMAMNVVRSSNQCKRKWEMLLDDYIKIRKWESLSREGSYWVLQEDRRKGFGLPASFQKEVFDAMNAVIQVQKHQSNSKFNDPDRIINVPEFETSYVDADSELITSTKNLEVQDVTASKVPEVEVNATSVASEQARAVAGKLQGNAERICAILSGDLEGGGGNQWPSTLPSLAATQSEVARRHADDLIKALAALTGCLDELSELISVRSV